MADERFEDHLTYPRGRGVVPDGACSGAAGGAACGDLVTIALTVAGDRVTAAGFEASGCGAVIAAGSAVVELVSGAPVLDAARVGSREVAAALGGLSVGKLHAADLASDALHRALGAAVRAGAAVPAPAGAERTLVAMSGGVDSAVAALLAAEGGAEVVTVTLELWADEDHDGSKSCCSADAVRGARSVAHRMGLPHLTLDLRAEFRAGVVDPWLGAHAAGLTPNPCVRCNGHVRLDAMLDYADRLGAATLTTGHYARKAQDGLLRVAADVDKDQSYMLARLDPGSIARLRFPLGELTKPAVRTLAADAELPVAQKPDSQDLCFLAGTGREAFLARHGGLGERPGDIVDRAGAVLGRHRGAHAYTVGQRRGVVTTGGTGEPLYVLGTDVRANTVTVGPREALAVRSLPVEDVVVHGAPARIRAARLRSHAAPVAASLSADGGELLLGDAFAGVAPGQLAVLMDGDTVAGHATISRR
ncbi:tRNA 2-thiouridine(34) synthase MnmA [Paraconexibacter antarcticus]|uniref:tRNA-specific 2-thiouridylase MnmA n=1 Tax=Paraconexibacter antarcticus TaxID=2949664 RepID=A0ABY5DMA5_9ACTN|nr:tRNA 2-thiouridine(34) synthase MnmA [Paraconexibacter antarcticus]UTI62530.1 tRNA 2-thiouridine(34) synthase MnmA [Paraconexibacter antarcticus]